MHRILAPLFSLLPIVVLTHCAGRPAEDDLANALEAACADGGCLAPPVPVTTADASAPGDPVAASAPSCSREHGGRTCGPTGKDDCCAVVGQGTARLDRYLITAGRMRAFIEKTQGNVQSFVDTLGDRWRPEWSEDDSLPFDARSALDLLGPQGRKKSCGTGDETGHTYWTPAEGAESSDLDQDTLDEKALNCVPWSLAQALCAYDGGRLATLAELKAAFTNDGTTRFPWGDDALGNLDAPDPGERLNIAFGFATDPLPATYRKRADGSPAGASFFISPPGRFPKGNNRVGVADAAGDLLEWVGDRKRQFVWKADFEHHAKSAASLNFGRWWWDSVLGGPWIWGTNQLFGQAGNDGERNGYYAIGARCAH